MGEKVMNAEQVVDLYEKVSELTGRMVEAARVGDWDLLIELEKSGRLLTSELMQSDVVAPTPPELRERKARLIRKVLADDAQIRDLAEPRLAQLAQMIQSGKNQRKLHTSYGA